MGLCGNLRITMYSLFFVYPITVLFSTFSIVSTGNRHLSKVDTIISNVIFSLMDANTFFRSSSPTVYRPSYRQAKLYAVNSVIVALAETAVCQG